MSAAELLAEHLIGNLDEDGYLRRDLDAIVNDLAFTQNVSCDQGGTGARCPEGGAIPGPRRRGCT